LHGKDILNASDFVKELRENDSNVRLYEVKPEEIAKKQNIIPSKLPTVPGTHKLHQIIYSSKGVIFFRAISCYCGVNEPHEHHKLTKFVFPMKEVKYANKNVKNTNKNVKTQSKNDNKATKVMKEPPIPVVTPVEVQADIHTEPNRADFFDDCLENFIQCSSYEGLKEMCHDVNRKMNIWPIDHAKLATIVNSGLSVDQKTMDIYPDDVQQTYVTFPVSVKADGNCLPYSGSVLAFGKDSHATEIRVRIIIEQALNEQYYLDQTNLEKGLKESPRYDIKKTFAMHSDEYRHGTDHLNVQTTIQQIYQREVMKIRQHMADLCSVVYITTENIFDLSETW